MKSQVACQLNNLASEITTYVEKFDLSAIPALDFAYYPSSNEISFSLVVTDDSSKYFSTFVKKEFPNIHADIFLWSLFHEIGHHETIDEWDDDEYDFFQQEKEKITKIKDAKARNMTYFYIEDEYAATAWAAQYLEEHQCEVATLWSNIQKMILNIYNEIER